MSASLPNGSIVSISSVKGPTKLMSAITNAVQAVGTLEAAHAVVAGDVVLMTSGWEALNGRVIRALSVATNDVTWELLDTSSTSVYPAGQGTGSIVEVSTFLQIPQIIQSSKSGGDQQFVQFQFLSSRRQGQLPTVKSPQALQFKIADDPTLSIYTTLKAADLDGLVRAVLILLPSGAKIYAPAVVSFNDTPSLDTNQVMGVDVTLSFQADITRYPT